MYLRTISRTNKDGSRVTYVQLAHNRRDPETKNPQAEVLYSFGRLDQLDLEALRRLVQSILRFLSPEDALQVQTQLGDTAPARFLESKPMGTAHLLQGLWDRLGVGQTLEQLAARRAFRRDVVAALFAMVANRALAPASKHAIPAWLDKSVALPSAPELSDDQLYRALDFLLTTDAELQQAVFFRAADLLNLEVDLLLYDTTSAYFEMEGDDYDLLEREQEWQAYEEGRCAQPPTTPRPQVVNDPAFRVPGYPRHRHPGAAQVVVGLAVTREGIPVRCWTFPGNTADVTTVRQVKADLRGWRLNRVIWAVDRGMVSDDSLRCLQQGGAHYVAGEKMRSGRPEVEAALSRPGRYQPVNESVEVKEVVVGDGEARRRYVLVRNPKQAVRDRQQREQALQRITEELSKLEEQTKRSQSPRRGHRPPEQLELKVADAEHDPADASAPAASAPTGAAAARPQRRRTVPPAAAPAVDPAGDPHEPATNQDAHGKAVCRLMAHPTLGRYLKLDRRGQPTLDRKKIEAEERLDGKYLLLTSDETLSPEDVALSYKQLLEVERAWRDLKSHLDLRPMHHRLEQRIRAHVLTCWLALLLVRVAETRIGETWSTIRQELDRLQRGVFETPAGHYVQTTELTALQKQYLAAVQVPPPPRFERITVAPMDGARGATPSAVDAATAPRSTKARSSRRRPAAGGPAGNASSAEQTHI